MKNIYLFLTFVCLAFYSNSQCEAPDLIDWFAEADDVYTIQFEASASATDYTVTFIPLYDDNQDNTSLPESTTYTGVVSAGTNLLSFDPSPSNPNNVPLQSYYYAVDLSVTCDGEEFYTDPFYMSRISLLNTPAYNCENFNVYNYLLPDGIGIIYDIPFEIESAEIPVQIDEMSVFLDLGHTYLGDLNITLTSPSGTTVTLLEYPNGFGGSEGLSVFFEENGSVPELTESEDGATSFLQGVFSPAESFSAFSGEQVAGTWVISITDNLAIDYGVLYGSCLNINTSPCQASISGEVYYDLNGNGIHDDDEPPHNYNFISVNGFNTVFSNASGEYTNCFEEGPISLNLANTPLYYNASPASYDFDLAAGENLTGYDFALEPIPGINDLVVDVYSVIPDVPGFERTYYVTYENLGTECIDNCSVSFSTPNGVTILSVDGSMDGVVTDQEMLVELGTLCPTDEGVIEVLVYLSEELVVDEVIIYETSINPIEGDETQENNLIMHESLVVASYDPNDKTVSDEVIAQTFLDEEKRLEYIVRFQNDGSFYAENVVIKDYIEEDLILESFELLGSSHPVEVVLDGNEMSFEFIGIQLPQSELGLEESQGYVRFSFQPQPEFTTLDVVENTAFIYFDFNSPIITNTAETVLDETISVLDIEKSTLSVYPNPVQHQININVTQEMDVDSFQITDMTGRVVYSKNMVNSGVIQIGVEELKAGVYVISLISDSGIKASGTFIKK